jgi:SAM-dependent methyltransferase
LEPKATSSVPTATKPLLHLGCGQTGRPGPGFLNCDLYPGPHVDVVFDLMQPWPFEEGGVQGIYASHVLEHLPDPMHFFREAYRVLEERCELKLRVPYGGHRAAWCDPTHLRPWFPESFAFLQPGYNEAICNPQHDGWAAPFVVEQTGLRLGRAHRWLRRVGPLRSWLLSRVALVPDAVEELWVTLFAVKTPEAVAYWRQGRPANAVPVRYLMYAHEWAGHVYQEGEPLGLVDISSRRVVPAGF